MADFIPPMILTIEARVAQAEADLKKITAQVDQFGKTAKQNVAHSDGLTGSFKKMAVAIGGLFALQKVTQLLGESARAAVEDNKSFALMERQMKATTGASHEQAVAINEQIGKLAQVSGVVDDNIRPAYSKLLIATKDTGEAMNLTSLAMDIAAATGKSATGVAMALARAHDGNFGALQRLVPGIKDATDKMGYLEKQFAGAAKVAGDADPYSRMNVALDQIKESIGRALLPLLTKFTDWLIDVTPRIEQFFKDLNDPATETGAKWKVFLDILKSAFDWITKNANVVMILVGAFAALKIVLGAVKLAQEAAAAAQWLLNIAMDANPVGAFMLLIGGLATLYLILAGNADKATAAQKRAGSYIGRGGSNVGRGQAGPDYSKYSSDEEKRFAARKGQFAADYVAPTITGSGVGGSGKGGTTKADPFVQYLKDTQKKITDARATYDKAVAAANDKYGALIKKYSDEMTDIIKQSMDRLKDVFAKAVASDVGSIFASLNQEGTATAEQLLKNLQDRLNAGKRLAENAATLAGLGYSQTFIEQLIGQGTETGNAMADALKNASPETQKAIQETFVATEKLAGTGMNDLAKTIYEKSGLATQELKDLFDAAQKNMVQAQKDLQDALVTAANTLNDSLDAIETAFNKKLASMASTASKYKSGIQGVYGALASAQDVVDYGTAQANAFTYRPSGPTSTISAGTTIYVENKVDTGGTPVDLTTVTANSIKFGLPYTLTSGGASVAV